MIKSDISIALCTYNGEKYIREQLNSIVHQSLLPDEIVICDDCSEDNTINIVKEFSEQYKSISWYVVKNISRMGVRANFEKAIRLTSCKYIATSDQDDIWEYNKLELLKTVLLEKHVALIHSDVAIVDANGNSIYKESRNNKKKTRTLDEYIFGENNVTGCTCLFTEELIKMIPKFPNEFFYHDQWLAIFAYNNGGIYFYNEKLIKYRIHSENVVASLENKKVVFEKSHFKKKAKDYLLLIQNKNIIKYSKRSLLMLIKNYFVCCIGLPYFKYNTQFSRKIFGKN